jgi:hypothetical protein
MVLLVSALLWVNVPRFGVLCSYRGAATTYLVGLCVAVWFLVGLRGAAAREAAGRGPRGALALAFLPAGLLAGLTTRPIATVLLVVCWRISRRLHPLPRWAIAGLAGVAAGAVVLWAPEAREWPARAVARGLDETMRMLKTQLRVPVWVASTVLALWLGQLAWRRGRGRDDPSFSETEVEVMTAGLAVGFGLTLLAVVGTWFLSGEMAGPSAASTVVVALALLGLARGRVARLALVGGALLVQLFVANASLRALAVAHRTYAARIAALEAAPRGSVATVPAYAQHGSSPWFWGDDLRLSSLRDRVATLGFGLRGIEISPPYRTLEAVPPLRLHHETGDAARFPTFYSADLNTARQQFIGAVRRTPPPVSARLVVDGVTIPGRPGEVLASWTEGRHVIEPVVAFAGVDAEGQLRLVPSNVPDVVSAWEVELASGAAQELELDDDDGLYRLRPGRRMVVGVVVCTAERCMLGAVFPL